VHSNSPFVVLFFGGCLVLAGCGGKSVPVNGLVKFSDGSDVSVLQGYEVSLQAEGGGASSYGTIEADGTVKLSTFGQFDGAVPGKYRVTITPSASPDPDKPPPKPAIPAKYGAFETSGLTVEVQAGANSIEWVLERAK
jgi:hypothetical protein